MKGDFKKIFASLKNDMQEFTKNFERIMSSNVKLIDTIVKYVVKHKGKQFRPALLMLASRSVGTPNRDTYTTAVVVELLHTATLVHDDVVDEAEMRRGFPTIHKVWKNKIAVLMGDYLLAKSLIAATETNSIKIMNTVATVAKRLIKGEIFEIQKSRNLDLNEDEYFTMIGDKTASLITACCELGALTVDATSEYREILRIYGENIGLAFQIKDDLLDYESNMGILGKPVISDLKEKKLTLPLIYSMHESQGHERRKVIKLIKNGATKNDIKYILNFINKYDGLNKTQNKALELRDRAIESINKLPDSDAKNSLRALAEFVVNRKK
jgi:octaprenyl-diphosphate synthase